MQYIQKLDNLLMVSQGKSYRFIDLFSGLGGFHLALGEPKYGGLGHECVFACDIDKTLNTCYFNNFGIMPKENIIDARKDVPPHDILCAGFPCQSFSKAGPQGGLEDKKRGTLIYEIVKILDKHKPEYFILENVPNIKTHDKGHTWEKIEEALRSAGDGYEVKSKEFSPHHFGIPQVRLRTYIVGKKGGLDGFKWPERENHEEPSIYDVLDERPLNARKLPPQVRTCIAVWQEFLNIIPKDEEIPHPVWSMEFGATYPYETTTPHSMSPSELRRYKGSFGMPLHGSQKEEIYKNLPSHAIRPNAIFPRWKINMIKRNREFYKRNKKLIDPWLSKIQDFPSSFQKLELNIGNEPRKLKKYILQCRASGLRVKRPTTSPSLVAMNRSQIPIIAWENRYMTTRECSRLQSMETLESLPETDTRAYRALGNAVNSKVVRLIASSLLNNGVDNE